MTRTYIVLVRPKGYRRFFMEEDDLSSKRDALALAREHKKAWPERRVLVVMQTCRCETILKL